MDDYNKILNVCQENQKLSRVVVDEFLLYYAAERDKLDKEMDKRQARYRHITSRIQKEWERMIKAQYIAHRIFKAGGLISKYLNHSAIKQLPPEEINFLKQAAVYPWRFSFSIIKNNPAEDFYEMVDVFRDEGFLLYSPGISSTLKEKKPVLWFNLIGFNGACWMSYGPISGYNSFEPDDIFFFATELRPKTIFEDDEDVVADVENNPVPYMMLFAGSNHPLSFTCNEQIVEVMAQYDEGAFDTRELKKVFRQEYNNDVFRLSLKGWDSHPHFATAFYDENEKLLTLYAMTEKGFVALVKAFNAYGYKLYDDPEVRINPSMRMMAGEILKKDIQLHPYEHLFEKASSKEEDEQIKRINEFINLALPDINAGKQPDIPFLAQKAGIDVKTAQDIMKSVMDKFDKMK